MVSSVRLMKAVPAALLLAVLACNGSPTEPSNPRGLYAVVTTPSLSLGADIPVILQNRSSGDIMVGPLGCSAGLERRDPATGAWQRLVSFKSCIQLMMTITEGADFAFNVPSPGTMGRYRVVLSAQPEGGADVEVRSNTFEVK